MEFAKGYENGMYSPIIQNQLMKELNINTIVPDKNDIEEALRDPINHEEGLVSYGQSYYFSSLMYKRNIEYLASLPAFDLELTCINATGDDYKSEQYKKDYNTIAKFLDRFNYTYEIYLNDYYYYLFIIMIFVIQINLILLVEFHVIMKYI